MISTELLRSKFAAALPYPAYVATGTPDQRENWARFEGQPRLTDDQRRLVASFGRRIQCLVISGVWCGDCVQQCPCLRLIESAAAPDPRDPGERLIGVRFIDRDQNLDLAEQVRICGGLRVPVVIFTNEDSEFVALAGDRTLARYRAVAARKLGASCPLPGAPVAPDEIAATLQDWVDEFERVHLLLRLSPKLRQRYGD
jgi:hypothetical protein